jgi:hypothetical protein
VNFDFNIYTPPLFFNQRIFGLFLCSVHGCTHLWIGKPLQHFLNETVATQQWNCNVVTCSFSLTGFLDSFIGSVNVWQQNYEMREAALPHPWNEHLSPFQKLILVRLFQPDKVSEVTEYGVSFVLMVK